MLTYCEHVYRDVEENPCEYCGKETHRINWDEEAKLAKKWREDNPNAGFGGWWSI